MTDPGDPGPEESMGKSDRRTEWAAFIVIAAGSLALAWWNRFVQDDAFISFRYAQNWAEGYGPVFNPGERVEGYTNFLWTALMVIPHKLGLEVVGFAWAASLTAFVVTLLATWRTGRAIFHRGTVGLAAVLLLGTNYSFLAYATGGLETQWQAMWAMLAAWLVAAGLAAAKWSLGRTLALSFVIAAALMTRLDSVLLIGPAFAIAAYGSLRADESPARRAALVAGLTLPALVLVGGWLAWKTNYYGDMLPNTFYAKTGGMHAILRGGFYVGLFFACYFLWPFGLVWLGRFGAFKRQAGVPGAVLVAGPVVIWLAYVVKVGGDFMEFRFIVPMMPLMFLAIAWLLVTQVQRIALRAGAIALLVAASVTHAVVFDTAPWKRGLESIQDLKFNLAGGATPWIDIGKALREAFEEPFSVHIAVTPAGAIPYYSRAKTTDMLGLNDAHVARHGATLSQRPGHYKIANIQYLRRRGVHLLIGHPQAASDAAADRDGYTLREIDKMFLTRGVPDPESLPESAHVIEIDLPEAGALIAARLTPAPIVEHSVRRHHWTTFPLVHDSQHPAAASGE